MPANHPPACPADILERIPGLLYDAEIERVAVFVGHRRNGTVQILDIWEAKNIHRIPSDHFAIGAGQWRKLRRRAARQGMDVVGIIHSHPHGHPDQASDDDVRFARRTPWAARAVFHSPTGQLIWYNPEGELHRQRLALPLLPRIINRLMAD